MKIAEIIVDSESVIVPHGPCDVKGRSKETYFF